MERLRISPFKTRWAFGLLGMLALAVTTVGQGIARGQEPAEGSLARYVPKDEKLFAFFEFEGLDAHRAAWEQSAAYKLLTQTKLGPLLEDLAAQAIDAMQQSRPDDRRLKGTEALVLIKSAMTQGFTAAGWGQDPRRGGFVLVLRGFGRPETLKRLAVEMSGPKDLADAPIPQRELKKLDPTTSMWIEKDDMVISNRPEKVFSVVDGKTPNANDHPLYATLVKKSDGIEPVAVGFVDLEALPPLPPKGVQLGLDDVKHVTLQWGFQEEALVSVIQVTAPSPRRGLLAMFDQPTFAIDSLPPLPAGLKGFTVFSFDLDATYGRIVKLTHQINPDGALSFARVEQAIRQRFGFDLRQDILKPLGPKIAVYSQSTPGAGGFSAVALIGMIAGQTIAIEARDEALSKNLDKFIDAINQIILARQTVAANGQPPAAPSVIGFRKQQANQPTYILNMPAGTVPPAVKMLIRPTLKLGKDQLVFGATPAAANRSFNVATLPAEKRWKPTDGFESMANRLPREMVLLTVSDPRETLPGLVQGLPTLMPQANQYFFPSVAAGREAAHRVRCTNNFKQIGLAMFNHHSAFNTYPLPAIMSKDGKPLLSWRVALLPYLEHVALYNKFHLDEPWDSPHNKALIKEMPAVFTCPDRSNPELGTTTYRRFVGPGALAENNQPRGMAQITDGTSNTIFAVEANDAVIWTKPDSDLPFDPDAASLQGAGSSHPGGFNVLMADASVKFLPNEIDPKMFRAMITCDRGEVVNWSQVPKPRPAKPGPSAGPLHVDVEKLPKPEELKPLLFPASMAITTENDGFRLVTRQPIPTISSPGTSAVTVALLLPAVQAAREAARRSQCVNNLKALAFACQNHHNASGAYPAPAITGEDGKPLLSWRVAVLPYLGEKPLYDRFKLDEPWDSPHNKALIKEMPKVFECPGRTNPQEGTTTYRAIVGPGAFFESGHTTKLAEITDGSSNTLMIVESTEAVSWTKPDELPFDPKAPPSLLGAGSSHPGGFNAAFADGAIHFLKSSINLDVWKRLITRAGGEVISADQY